MATYSKYGGTNYYAVGSTLVLLDGSTQSYTFTENKVFTDLLDNEIKLIYPDRLRNAILSLYDSVPLKETFVGNTYYIGIDNNDQNLKKTIYIGNRNFENTELVSSAVVASADVILNSTNADSSTYTNSTVVSLLAGTDTSLFRTAPKLDSRIVVNNDLTTRIDLSFVNQNGQISVLSKPPGDNDPGGVVYINGVGYPTIQNSGASASEEKTLSYESGNMVWSETTPYDPGFYGATGTNVPILGLETYVNGFSLEFSDVRECPITIGGVSLGQTFDGNSLDDVLESIVYGYMPPSCTLNLINDTISYSEIGTSPTIILQYTVTKKTLDTKPIAMKNMRPNQLAPIISNVSTKISGTATGVAILPLEKKTTVFEIVASDGQQTTSASASITGIYPIFYGLTSSAYMDTYTLSIINKIVSNKKQIKVDVFRSSLTTQDKLFFVYDVEYGQLSSILDPNGIEVVGGFDVNAYALSSPDGLWASKVFYVYTMNNFYAGYVGPFTVSSFFTFTF